MMIGITGPFMKKGGLFFPFIFCQKKKWEELPQEEISRGFVCPSNFPRFLAIPFHKIPFPA
jgi:hypothetical protein